MSIENGECIACSGKLVKTHQDGVSVCVVCGGVHGVFGSREEALKVVDFSRFSNANNDRYFDFTFVSGLGTTDRVHGLYNERTKIMTQCG